MPMEFEFKGPDWDDIIKGAAREKAEEVLDEMVEERRRLLIAELGPADAARVRVSRGPLGDDGKCRINFAEPDDLKEKVDAFIKKHGFYDSDGD
jgi:hypothetical protein